MLEIRDPQTAREHLLTGMLVSRAGTVTPKRLVNALRWAKEIASQGSLLPPLGFVSDVGILVDSLRRGAEVTHLPDVRGLEHTMTRRYEDYVLGKIAADSTFQRGADAVLRHQDRDRDRSIAYLLERISDRARLPGTQLSPAVIEGLLKQPSGEALQDAWTLVEQVGVVETVLEQTEQLILQIRNCGQLLGGEDLFELESGTALIAYGQRIALRQVLRWADLIQSGLPPQRPRVSQRRYSVASHLLQEDQYPIGGFTSIANRGTMESLVRSELAYMDPHERPDLFDIKYSRNELLYYSRDENKFLRRRICLAFVLYPDLIQTRLKTDQMPVQGVIMLLATLYAAVRQLTQWLSDDALLFEFIWVRAEQGDALNEERELIDTLFRDAVAAGTVSQRELGYDEVAGRLAELGRQAFCQTLCLSSDPLNLSDDEIAPNSHCAAVARWDRKEWSEQLNLWLDAWCV